MEVKRLLFKSSEIDLRYAASTEGIWGEYDYFVPMNAIRMWIFHKDGKDGKWMAFSDNYEWIYVSHHPDDFIRFLLETLPAVERFEVTGDGSCGSDLLYMENEMSLNYSFKTDFLMEIESKELPLGDVHHKFWLYNWAHNVSMVGDKTDTYTLKETEIEKLNDDVNDLFVRGFFHQTSAKYLFTQELEPQNPIWVFEAKDNKYYFTDQLYDQQAAIKDLTWYHFQGETLELNIVMLPELETLIFKKGPEIQEFLRMHGCPCIEKSVIKVENRTTETGKSTFHLQLENGEFLFINRSERKRYLDGQIYDGGHYRRLFYMRFERSAAPEVDYLLDTNVKQLWHGKPNDVQAPDYVKSFVRLKNDQHVHEEKEGRNGCIMIGVVVAVVLGLLIYWIFW